MVAVRVAGLACAIACGACGRFGVDGSAAPGDGSAAPGDDSAAPGDGSIADAIDRHLHVADGWSIAQLVDLTGLVPYDPGDFTDGTERRANDPSYTAALYSPFDASLVVIAGRSLIALADDGSAVVHSYRPADFNTTGPDAPGRATFADLGAGGAGLWLTSASMEGGDGLYLITSDWSISVVSTENNTYPLALDPAGDYDMQGSAALYYGSQGTLQRRIGAQLATIVTPPGAVNDLATKGNALFLTIEGDAQVLLDRVGPGQSPVISELARSADIELAEGSTNAGLFGIIDNAALVTISPRDGAFVRDAWTDDPDWVWRSVCVPRAGNRFAGSLIVLESNRRLDQDRLLLVIPP